jgi:hypothetical protein
LEVTWVNPPVVWSLRDQSDLLAVVQARLPAIEEVLSELGTGFVAQTLPVAGHWGPFHRPFGHWRALYRVQPELCCLAFKGTESYTQELEVHYNALLDRYAVLDFSIHRPGLSERPTSATLSVLDRFLYVEGKFPGTVLMTEALSEARTSAAFQLAHYRRYGCLACVPLPLAVYQVQDEVVEQIVQAVCRVVDEHSRACVQRLASPGFAVLVYWFPHLPLRVAHVGLPADLSPDERLKQLSHGIPAGAALASPEMIVENWVNIVVRMLALGYVPADPRSAIRGSCVDAPNLTLDGGMVDLDSMRPLDSFRNQAEIHNAIEQSIEILQRSISLYLVGDRYQGGDCGPLRQEIVQRLRQEQEALPSALREYLKPEGCYQRILLKQRADWRLAGNL